jgi:hypothetical protein
MRMVSEVRIFVWRNEDPENSFDDPSKNLDWAKKLLQEGFFSYFECVQIAMSTNDEKKQECPFPKILERKFCPGKDIMTKLNLRHTNIEDCTCTVA